MQISSPCALRFQISRLKIRNLHLDSYQSLEITTPDTRTNLVLLMAVKRLSCAEARTQARSWQMAPFPSPEGQRKLVDPLHLPRHQGVKKKHWEPAYSYYIIGMLLHYK